MMNPQNTTQMDMAQRSLVCDAIQLTHELRKPEMAQVAEKWGNNGSSENLIQYGYKGEDKKVLSLEESKLLQDVYNVVDKGQHSGFSWSYVEAVARVIMGYNRTDNFMNWIEQAEYIEPGIIGVDMGEWYDEVAGSVETGSVEDPLAEVRDWVATGATNPATDLSPDAREEYDEKHSVNQYYK